MSNFKTILEKYSAVNTHNGTDKITSHSYGSVYSQLFSMYQDASTLLEIGFDGGASLQAYSEYFQKAKIYGIDIEDHRLDYVKQNPRIETYIADATKQSTIDYFKGPFDILIEDASHLPEHQIQHFQDYSNYVKPGGLYIIEDVAEANKSFLEEKLSVEAEKRGFDFYVFDLRPIKSRFDDILFVFQKRTVKKEEIQRFLDILNKQSTLDRRQLESNIQHVFKMSPFTNPIDSSVFLEFFLDSPSKEQTIFFTKVFHDIEWRLFLEVYLFPHLLFAPFYTCWDFPLQEYLQTPRPMIPDQFTRVSLDVGMAFNGPNTSEWVKNPSMFVLGFEPNPTNLRYLHMPYDQTTPPPNYPYPRPEFWLDSKYIGKQVQIFPFALSNELGTTDFYCTNNDPGTSSMYKPVRFELETKTTVPKKTLSSILFWFPWHRIPIIDHLKIDAQGHDFEILLGALAYLDKIAYINVEMSVEGQYESVPNKFPLINILLQNRGFQAYSMEGGNCSYFNTKLKDYCFSFKPQFIDL